MKMISLTALSILQYTYGLFEFLSKERNSMAFQFQMQYKGQVELQCLQNYSSQQISLLNSRRRLNCQASQRSSDLERENDQEIIEFRREIEERFKHSISNKIYTFPKLIKTIRDILSSSQSQSEDDSFSLKPNGLRDNRVVLNFKKKINLSPGKNPQNSNFSQSVKKGKDKLRTNDSTNKRKDDGERIASKYDKPSNRKEKRVKDKPRIETQGMDSVRRTMKKH